MKRINVIGTSGSGKSHFSRQLAQKLDVPCIEMDAIFWLPDWQHLETEAFHLKLKSLLEQDAWVLDGNQSKTNALKWQYTDTIIWLDYSFLRTFRQIVIRSCKRSWTRREIWEGTGNTESFRRNFLSSDSVILWMLKNYWKTRQKYTTLFNSELANRVRFVHITSPEQAEQFLADVQSIKANPSDFISK